jgi:hypothetical protein
MMRSHLLWRYERAREVLTPTKGVLEVSQLARSLPPHRCLLSSFFSSATYLLFNVFILASLMLRTTLIRLSTHASRSPSVLGVRSFMDSVSPEASPTALLGDHLKLNYVSRLCTWKMEKHHQGSRAADFGEAIQLALPPSPMWRASVKYYEAEKMVDDDRMLTWGHGATEKAAQTQSVPSRAQPRRVESLI